MSEDVGMPEGAVKKISDKAVAKVFRTLLGFARGTLYAFAIVFFARLLSFGIERIEILLPTRDPDPYYSTLKIGLSFLGGWGSLLWFAFYSLQDLVIEFVYQINRKDRRRE